MKKKGRKKSQSVRAHGKVVRRIRWRNTLKPSKDEKIIMMAGEPEAERERVERAPLPPVP